jgi:hypothetical protein
MKSIVIILLLARVASADVNIASIADDTNVVSLRTGAEQGLVVGAGYARGWRHLVIGGELVMGFAEADPGDMELRATITAPLLRRGNWYVLGTLAPSVRRSDSAIAQMTALAGDATIHAGRYAPRWFAALELGFDAVFTTHIENSDEYRMQVYADARDGWYSTPGGTLRYGATAGVAIARYDVSLRAGKLRDIGGGDPLVPFYATLTFDARF